jgi:PIN domain nuclease of toxin-antitoxin system
VRLLLDTQLLVWWFVDRRIPRRANELIRDPANRLFASAASIWEIAIKASLGKIEVEPVALDTALRDGGFLELPVSSRHGMQVALLPLHHRDPFDRLLVAQSMCESMPLLTGDRALAAYGPLVMVAE